MKIYAMSVLLWFGLLQTEGFIADTLISTQQGFVPIQFIVVGDIVNDRNCVTHVVERIVNCCIEIRVGDCVTCAAPDQKFYLSNVQKWVNASDLIVSDELLCRGGKTVGVEAIEVVSKSCIMHALSVEMSHIFYVTPYEIIVHNMEPAGGAAIAFLSVVCPPAGVVLASAEAVALGVIGIGAYCAYKKHKKQKAMAKGCFSADIVSRDCGVSKDSGCYALEATLAKPAHICEVPVEKVMIIDVIPSIEDADKDTLFHVLPVVEAEPLSLCFEETNQKNGSVVEEQKKRYDGPMYSRTEDWINKHPFGRKIKKALFRSQYTNQGKRAFEVVKKIEDCDGFNKGNYVAVDALHEDHLEVFNKRGEWVNVANFDGTKNIEKTKQGQKESRRPLW